VHIPRTILQAQTPSHRADVTAAYVNAKITGIAQDLATVKPGGRNTAIYTAALKVGSALGAARSTLGAEPELAAWTDDAAEDVLMSAAERNGYVAVHSTAASCSAIRSGLRNGLRDPRPLPAFAELSEPSASRSPALNQGQNERQPGAGNWL
jgi:hypothetical protein